jgi:hypothetical protein
MSLSNVRAPTARIISSCNIFIAGLALTALVGCGASGGSSAWGGTTLLVVNPQPVAQPEFISLEHRATVEFAQLTIGQTSYLLNQSNAAGGGQAMLLFKEGDVPTDAGGDDQPTAAIMFRDDEVKVMINLDGDGDVREMDIADVSEADSTVVAGETVFTATGTVADQDVRLVYPTSMEGMGTSAVTIDEEASAIVLSGTLGARTYNQIFDLLEERDDLSELQLVNIRGSINDEINMQTGRLVREAGFLTVVPAASTIASGGVDMFCAGLQRYAEAGSTLLVHSWGANIDGEVVSAHELPIDHPGHQAQIAYFTEMLGAPLGPDFYWFTINSAPFGEPLHRMTAEEIVMFGLNTSVIQ